MTILIIIQDYYQNIEPLHCRKRTCPSSPTLSCSIEIEPLRSFIAHKIKKEIDRQPDRLLKIQQIECKLVDNLPVAVLYEVETLSQ